MPQSTRCCSWQKRKRNGTTTKPSSSARSNTSKKLTSKRNSIAKRWSSVTLRLQSYKRTLSVPANATKLLCSPFRRTPITRSRTSRRKTQTTRHRSMTWNLSQPLSASYSTTNTRTSKRTITNSNALDRTRTSRWKSRRKRARNSKRASRFRLMNWLRRIRLLENVKRRYTSSRRRPRNWRSLSMF